ncbi:SprT-like domain-containing protein [Xanthomonas perforans]|uniref:SprT-like domain-containing protein n=1 Tax=Xanthomonas perforans TaxID=442694 RepID=UPI00235869A4|nr:SprT-like domain-containing protein [Xanthomonas perforans]MDC9654391.1 SprT-like domain-containing protein [Xanthomonas perforans]MEB2159625.1 SprT-like domain-containing protein [Xanthomonas campestris pv. campestris]
MDIAASSLTASSIVRPTLEYANELQLAFDHFNDRLFGGQLEQCVISLQRTARCFGYYSPKRFINARSGEARSEISINPQFLANYPVIESLQTLVHEMVHMWQDKHGKPGRRGYHNREWGQKMESIGLMPSSTGRPGGAKLGEKMADYVIEGGLFQQHAMTLLTQDFRLSWWDRFAMPGRPNVNTAPARPRVLAAGHNGDSVSADDETDSEAGATDSNWMATTHFELDPQIAQQLAIRDTRTNGSNRLKYTCLACSINVWGKPGLRIICGECNEAFSATSYVDTTDDHTDA